MDVKYINPLLVALLEVLPQIGFQSVEKQSLSLHDASFPYNGILINISLFGTVKGAILFGLDTESAKLFASKMMMGLPIAELNEIAKSALSEMANMVCANTCTQYTKIGITDMDISPPMLLMCDNGEATLPVPKSISIKYLIDGIPMNVYVGLVSTAD